MDQNIDEKAEQESKNNINILWMKIVLDCTNFKIIFIFETKNVKIHYIYILNFLSAYLLKIWFFNLNLIFIVIIFILYILNFLLLLPIIIVKIIEIKQK